MLNEVPTYETTAGLGYNKKAYLYKTNATDYMVIGGENLVDDDYVIGEIIEGLEDSYVEESIFNAKRSPIYGTILLVEQKNEQSDPIHGAASAMYKAMESFVKDFEDDYVMDDGRIVDNPHNMLVVNYNIFKGILSAIKSETV